MNRGDRRTREGLWNALADQAKEKEAAHPTHAVEKRWESHGLMNGVVTANLSCSCSWKAEGVPWQDVEARIAAHRGVGS